MCKVAIIIPYFGELPNYFDLWLKSAERNTKFDFLIFTDNVIESTSKNINIFKMSFEDCVNIIQKNFRFKIKLESPYRLCVFKPAYGEIFKDWLISYDWWGWGDLDVIYGNLEHFFSKEIFEKYEKVLTQGHLSFQKNTHKMNTLYKKRYASVMNYKDVFKSGKRFHNFDEYPYGLARQADLSGISTYKSSVYADLDTFFYTFKKIYSYQSTNDDKNNIKQIFKWKDGKLLNIIQETDNTLSYNELAYVHFQKRKMDYDYKITKNTFFIVPNKFIYCDKKNEKSLLDQIDFEMNEFYHIPKKVSVSSIKEKYFDKYIWKDRIFKFKVQKIMNIRPYKYEKDGF